MAANLNKEKQARLSPFEVRRILDYDPNTGDFVWRHRTDRLRNWNAYWPGRRAGTLSVFGRVIISLDGVKYYAHRLAWLHYYGEWPSDELDHIDGNPLNNSILNLRVVTGKQNSWNVGAGASNSTGIKNITKDRHGGYNVRFVRWRTNIYSGYFADLDTAIAIRNLLAPNVYGVYDRRHQ